MSQGPVIHFFAGKGGAGKSTLAVAFAQHLLEVAGKEKTLLLSLEQPGGAADLLKKKLSTKPAKLAAGKGQGGLFAAEVDQPKLAAALVKDMGAVLAEASGKGAVLSADEVKRVLAGRLLEVGELAVMFHLLDLSAGAEYQRVVVDGLSTTHALRLFDQAAGLKRLLTLVRGDKPVRGNKKEVRPPSPVDALVDRADAVLAMLKDPERFGVHVVAVAEPVADAQVRLLMKELTDRGIGVVDIVTNMIEDGKGSREVANRRGLQAPHVRKYQTLHPKVDLLGRRIVGPRGPDELKKFGKDWASGKETKALAFSPAEAPPALVRAPSMPPIAAPPLPPTRFIFFVGPGGVGKSSCAAAAAVTLTEKEGPVLLLSTDTSHSLSDVLQSRLTDTETQVKGTKGLYAREIDFGVWFGNLRKKFKELAEPLFGPEARGEAFALDKALVRNLLDAAPEGIDELAALWTLTDALVQERFKRIVIDTAPSASVPRLLELPPVAKAWLGELHAVLSKYRAKGAAPFLAWIEHLQQHIARFEQAILNPNECRFVVVTRGEEAGVPAAERLVATLRERKLPVERVLVNRVLPKTTCPITEERRRNELEVARLVEKKIGLPVTMAPALGRHPAGLRELKAFRTSWYALSASSAKTRAA